MICLETRLKRNVFLKALEAVVTIIASFTQLAVISRAYEPFVVGEYQLTLAWLFLVSALSCFGGIVMISTRDLSQCGEHERKKIFSSAIFLQVLVALPLCIAAIIVFHTFLPQIAIPLAIGTVGLLGAVILQVSQALLISRDLISKVVIASVIAQLVGTFAIFLAASAGCSLTMLVGAWSSFNITLGAVLFYQSQAWQAISLRLVNVDLLRRLTVEVLPILVMVFATHLYVRIDVIMLDHYTNNVVVARYGASYLFLDQLMILSNFMMSALFPNFARAASERGGEFHVLYQGILRLFAKYLVPTALLIALFSQQLLGLIYGADYAAGWPVLSILMLAALFAWINGPSGTIFITLKKQYVYMWATLLSLLVNIVGNLILIPIIGAAGAAISTVLTELAICSFCFFWIYRQTGYLPWMSPRVRG